MSSYSKQILGRDWRAIILNISKISRRATSKALNILSEATAKYKVVTAGARSVDAALSWSIIKFFCWDFLPAEYKDIRLWEFKKFHAREDLGIDVSSLKMVFFSHI